MRQAERSIAVLVGRGMKASASLEEAIKKANALGRQEDIATVLFSPYRDLKIEWFKARTRVGVYLSDYLEPLPLEEMTALIDSVREAAYGRKKGLNLGGWTDSSPPRNS